MDKGIERCCEKGKAPAEPGDWRLMSGMDRHTANDQLEDAAVQDGAAAESAAAEAVGEQPSGAAVAGDAAAAVDAAVTGRLDSAAVEGVAGAAAAVAEHAKTAKEYRQTADEHVKTLKDFWKDFLVSGIFILAAIVIIFACLAWFAANNRVNATGSSISAKGSKFSLMVQQSVSDDATAKKGAYTTAVSDSDYMLVNQDSNFNDDSSNPSMLRPGASGKFRLKVHRTEPSLNSVKIAIGLNPTWDKDYKADDKTVERNSAVSLLLGHIQFFYSVGNTSQVSQFYDGVTPIIPADDGSRSVTLPLNSDDCDFIVYWVWPEQFSNYIATGGASDNQNLFEQSGETYISLLNELKNTKSRYFLNSASLESIDISNEMSNDSYNKCVDQYDAADDLLGDAIDYLTVSFQASESQGVGVA